MSWVCGALVDDVLLGQGHDIRAGHTSVEVVQDEKDDVRLFGGLAGTGNRGHAAQGSKRGKEKHDEMRLNGESWVSIYYVQATSSDWKRRSFISPHNNARVITSFSRM